MDLAALARKGRLKRVEVEVDGGKLTVDVHVPVGRTALEFTRQSFALSKLAQELGAVEKAGGDTAELADALNAESLGFVFDWLPRLAPALAEMDEAEIGNIVRVTGMNASPLVTALLELVPSAMGAEGAEGLEDLPFSSAARPAIVSTT